MRLFKKKERKVYEFIITYDGIVQPVVGTHYKLTNNGFCIYYYNTSQIFGKGDYIIKRGDRIVY